MKYGICPKCKCECRLNKHHIKPVRFWGKGRHNNSILYICRNCHDLLEAMIPYEKQKVSFYYQILKVFGIEWEVQNDL
jgi:hypothetical protein